MHFNAISIIVKNYNNLKPYFYDALDIKTAHKNCFLRVVLAYKQKYNFYAKFVCYNQPDYELKMTISSKLLCFV